MKKLILSLTLMLLALSALPQMALFVSGTVNNLNGGGPIAGHEVYIHNDSISAWYFNHTVVTDASGFFADTITLPPSAPMQGNLYVGTYDCQISLNVQSFMYSPSQTSFAVTFSICWTNTGCDAYFLHSQTQPLKVQFTDNSVGGGNVRTWEFGDGSTSSLLNPLHQYSQPGTYNVTLTIGALGTTCYDVFSDTINVWDSTGGGCQASYYTYPDSSNTPYTYHFINTSFGPFTSWFWDLGDGTTSSNYNPVHTYAQPGTYNVCLTVSSGDSSCFDTYCSSLVVNAVSGCQAYFTSVPDTFNINARYFFDQSYGNITSWLWNFGDGSPVVSAQSPYHLFPAPGTYNVCLTVLGADSTCYDVSCQSITVGGMSNCVANFTHTPQSGNPAMVHFYDQSTGNITNWLWNFGDGVQSTEPNPVHTYAAAGYYAVALTVSSPNQWCSDTFTDTLYVGAPGGCQANFTYQQNPTSGNYTVYFTDLSTGNPTSWMWIFADGTTSSLQNPVHTFGGPGTYNVCLYIANNTCASNYCLDVVIQDSVSYHQIYGQVFAGNFPLTSGIAMIFSSGVAGNAPYIDVFPIDSNGIYYFTMVPDGDYYILAIPTDSNGYLPTYYGDEIAWEQASVVSLGPANNPYDIHLVSAIPLAPGPGSASGQINGGDVSSALVSKINMILKNAQGQPAGFARVTEAGAFEFGSLAYGTYYLKAELPGMSSDQVTIILTEEHPHAEIVMTMAGNSIMGMEETKPLTGGKVFPNPVRDNLTLTVNAAGALQTDLNIFDISGTSVYHRTVSLAKGSNLLQIPAASLPEGIYLIRLAGEDGTFLTTRFIRADR